MNKFFLLITASLLTTATAFADVQINETNFPDENFRKWILSQDYGSDGVLTNAEIESIMSIDVSNQNISDLTGINFFKYLDNLWCDNNSLEELEVSNLLNLTLLSCRNNSIKGLDVSMLTHLSSLYCQNNQLTSLNVSGLTGLGMITCENNQLTELDVSNLLSLVVLSCSSNSLKKLDVSNLPNFIALDCLVNQLTSLNLSDLPNFTRLDCQGNQLSSLAFSNLPNFTDLQCRYNQLISLDVSNLPNLTFLDCFGNQLTALDVSNNTALTKLSCYYNQLTELDVSNNTALTELSCFENQLTELDLSNNTALTELYCSNNQLAALNVSNNTALTLLSCFENQLTALDLSNNTALTALLCNHNQLTSLAVSESANFEILFVFSNYMSDFSDVRGFNGEWETQLVNENYQMLYGYLFNPQIRVIDEINEVNFPDENRRNWLLDQNNGNPEIHLAEYVWITHKDKDTESIYTDVIEDCTYSADNIVSAKIIEYAIDPDYVPDNNHNNKNKEPHAHAYAVWEIVKKTGETITHKAYYCLDGKNSASADNMTHLVYLSVVCANPLRSSQQNEITIHTFTALAVLEGGTTTGIADIESGKIVIYPNPAKNELRIESNGLEITKLEIVDLSGKTIYQFNNLRNQINVSALSKGIYFVKIETEKGVITQKFIKE